MRRLTFRPHRIELVAGAGLEPAPPCLLDKRSCFRLSYAAPGGLGKTLVDWVRLELTPNSLQDFYAAITSPARGEVLSAED